MTNYYDVYIGNLSTTVSTEKLKDLFCQVGQISHVWINQSFKRITYGFVGFTNLYAAEEACNRFNNQKLDFFEITVRLSNQTKLKLANKPKRANNSILLELPKKKGHCKNHVVKLHLLKDLIENKEIAKDFVQAYSEAENIAFPEKFEIVKTTPEPPSLTALESTVIRYFKSIDQKKPLQVDFDLSKGKLLSNEQYDKFFNMQLTKPRPISQPKPIKRKIPIAFDYRSVVDDEFF